ncbi:MULTISPECIES: recombinase family protein [unclassified Pseudonocardia]|uniref:recombinase family protein n=1 Tax=unclassified Pseudonocardia TaxID=2619320 RepID=UPI0001FFEC44|nr:recombinase family protein [Pseudonocardia sp. Ae707_Ps1]OLM21309.1 Resolvase, N-terminal domain [Pseudonocardia sp. Ae707_Ps1]
MVGYVRVSTEEQTRSGHGLGAQRDAIATEAERKGWELEWAVDEGASGKRINPQLQRALDLLATGQADALVVSKLDRLARSVLHAADIMELARRQGWNLIVLDMGMDLSTPQGRALAQTMAVFAELEREMIGIRTKEALASARKRGTRLGRPPLVETGTRRRIVQMREAGESFRAIARALEADEVLSPTGRLTWQESTVRRIYQSTEAPPLPSLQEQQ